jgi:flagellar hook-associated protein FlgK
LVRAFLVSCGSRLHPQQGFDVTSQTVEILFGYHCVDPSGLNLFKVYCSGGDRKENNRCFEHSGVELAGSLETVHAGHRKVQNNQIGTETLHFLKSVQTVYRFATNLETGFGL